MKKIFTLLVALTLVSATQAQYFTKIWAKFANGTDFTWFNNVGQINNATGIAYNPITNKVLVANRNDNIYVLNTTTGAQEGTVTLGGDLGTEAFKFTKIRVTSDGVIYGISLATGAGTCKIYRWASQTTAPTLCASFTVTERCGDAFALSGSGNTTTLYASGAGTTSNSCKIYVLTTNDGTNFLNTSTIDVASSNAQWTNRSVDPIGATPSAGVWIDMSGGPARRLTISGSAPSLTSAVAYTTVAGINSGQVADSYCGMRYLAPDAGGKKYLAFAGANNAGDGVTMKLLDVTSEAAVTTVGTDTLQTAPNTPFTYQTNGNGTGDVAFKKNGDGSYDFYYVATNNGIACVRSAQTLPVSLSSFSAAIQNKAVKLNWSTSSEINNNGFSVEKSINGVDFSEIGFVGTKADKGTASSTLSYDFIDNKFSAGKSFYRIKQIDKDGKFSYSEVRSLQNMVSVNGLSFSILGNPVKDRIVLNVKSKEDDLIVVKITSANGSIVYTNSYKVIAGESNLTIAASNLPKGVLLISVSNATEQKTIKVVKE